MDLDNIIQQFITGMKQTGLIEYIAVFAGIASVWFSRKENVLVYPIGLINTIFYIYISYKGQLGGEAAVNLYYTIMSIYGWILWSKKDNAQKPVLKITDSSNKEWFWQLAFFAGCYFVIFFSLTSLQKAFLPGAIPWADGLASASAFTGMWLMTRKKTESWIWWIITNIASIPLYFVKGYVFTSVYYLILLILAIAGLLEWKKRAHHAD
ncbi:MAG: nicotinamide riboside transporter PnuC [Ferruginibacter sp.]